jgi:mycothiol synthase
MQGASGIAILMKPLDIRRKEVFEMYSAIEKESTFAYLLRPMGEEDIERFVDFSNECAARENVIDSITLEEFTEWHHNPTNRDKVTLALLTDEDAGEGKIIGAMSFAIFPPIMRSRGWLFHVHPDYRDNGVGSALYKEYIRQAEEAGATEMSISARSEAALLMDFLVRRGHELDRWHYIMQLPAEVEVEAARMPEGIITHTFMHGQDEQLLADVRNVTFAEHYGSVPRTIEEMTYRTRQADFHADGVFFAFDGDKPAGFCYTSRDPREAERRGEMVGHIQLLGVMPVYRGRGLGRVLLLVGVNYLRQYVPVVELGVEGKNDTAIALYESVGFKRYKAWANMVKARGGLLTTDDGR